jgi:uncharacterized protein (TIGR03437 family)
MHTGNSIFASVFSIFCLALPALPQSAGLTCVTTAVPASVRAEGLAERMGDIVLSCTGGASGNSVSGNLMVYLTANVTNRLSDSGATDVQLTLDNGSGPVPTGVPAILVSANSIVFNGLSFTVPPSGRVELRVTNLRGAANQSYTTPGQPVQAFISFSNPTVLSVNSSQFTVARVWPGLLAGYATSGIPCNGSRAPDTVSMSGLFAAGTRFASTRVTEGFADAFRKKAAFEDAGTRILLRFSGFPAGSRLFVPDVVAGSDAVEPTSAGDLGLPLSGGQYQPTAAGSLLLARVANADARGAGGSPVYTPGAPGSAVAAFNSAGEVTLASGSGTITYEVVDSSASTLESAQIPVFLGIAGNTSGNVTVASESVSFAPLSSVATASLTEPVPRFADIAPQQDCTALGDCNASYFPRMVIEAPALEFTALAASAITAPKYVPIRNEGAGIMHWTARVTYAQGADWLRLDPSSGVNNGTVRLDALPSKLAAGTYNATLTIDAGPLAGSRNFPVHLVVTSAPVVVNPLTPAILVEVTTIQHGATFASGPLVPGGVTTLKGPNFSGKQVSVTLDGTAANVLYTSQTQINFVVPASLAGKSQAELAVTVDDRKSIPRVVPILETLPGVFNPGILNQDNTVNDNANPAAAGSVIQVFATGLNASSTSRIWMKVHDVDNLVPIYAGPSGIPGLDQVNVRVPEGLPAMVTSVVLCASPASDPGKQFCSPQVPITLK